MVSPNPALKISETVRDYAYLILTSQASTRGPIIGHDAQELEAQEVFLNTFENVINRSVNIPEDKQRLQKALQYARSKVDYSIGEGMYMLPSNMNLRIGKVKNYNNKIMISKPGFNLGTNLKVNLDDEKDKPDVKPKNEPNMSSMKNTNRMLNLTPAPIKNTNKILNLTSSSIKNTDMILIRSPMRNKR